MKFASKLEFEVATQQQWDALWQAAEECPKKSSAQKRLRQTLAHLHAWHRLLLNWYQTGLTDRPTLPAKGFKWNQTRELNAKLDAEFEKVKILSVKRRLKLSHNRVMKLVERLTEKQFSQSGQYSWTGKNPLSSYIVPNTFSHYRWAIKRIRKLK